VRLCAIAYAMKVWTENWAVGIASRQWPMPLIIFSQRPMADDVKPLQTSLRVTAVNNESEG